MHFLNLILSNLIFFLIAALQIMQTTFLPCSIFQREATGSLQSSVLSFLKAACFTGLYFLF